MMYFFKQFVIILVFTILAFGAENNLEKNFTKIPNNEKDGALFLLLNMEENDKNTLSESLFLENLKYAYLARDNFLWAKNLNNAIFFNDVLPYAVVDETRDSWRPEFFEIFGRLIKEKNCQTAAEAAEAINLNIREILKVEYSTKRAKPNQSPSESIKQKMASCTGLSILLINAFRAVGIPARMVGVFSWANKKGNHNWVEVFFDGKWHFTEYYFDSQGFNNGWFVDDCAFLKKDVPENNVWATSFEKSTEKFPAVWAKPENWFSSGINRTDFYIGLKKNKEKNLSVVAIDKAGIRVAVSFSVSQGKDIVYMGKTADEFADMNNVTALNLSKGNYLISYINSDKKSFREEINIDDESNVIFNIKY